MADPRHRCASPATALAKRVFPVPGGPTNLSGESAVLLGLGNSGENMFFFDGMIEETVGNSGETVGKQWELFDFLYISPTVFVFFWVSFIMGKHVLEHDDVTNKN